MDALRVHPAVIVGGIYQENPFYVPPDEFLNELRERNAKPEVRSQKSEVRSQKSEVRGQKSEVRDQRSEIRSQMADQAAV